MSTKRKVDAAKARVQNSEDGSTDSTRSLPKWTKLVKDAVNSLDIKEADARLDLCEQLDAIVTVYGAETRCAAALLDLHKRHKNATTTQFQNLLMALWKIATSTQSRA